MRKYIHFVTVVRLEEEQFNNKVLIAWIQNAATYIFSKMS
jgi:hypothetical protein